MKHGAILIIQHLSCAQRLMEQTATNFLGDGT